MLGLSPSVIVVGAGHAGCEAAYVAARLGHRVQLLTLRLDRIGWMSCNPAIGGMGKGHLVKEIDALGGLMARCTDEAGIQFRTLNTRRGPAVQGSRAQVDRFRYAKAVQKHLEATPGIELIEGMAVRLLCDASKLVQGVELEDGRVLHGGAVVLTTGTFLNGISHVGEKQASCGREGDRAAVRLSQSLVEHGLELLRFKTGTTPRLDGRTIELSSLELQEGDSPPLPFSIWTPLADFPRLPQRPCYVSETNPQTHDIIRENLNRSPLFGGTITGTGARYCPSIEDKIHRFADRSQHTIFLEPEGLDTPEVYPAGLSTSLPEEVQLRMLRSMRGLSKVEILRAGYAIEYDLVKPGQIEPSLAVKGFVGLYLAGQINGTSGYEEAAAQGLLAGWNAARLLSEEAPIQFRRDQAYLGVLVDDLCTQGTDEPYRMFTSRAEHRLSLREDNADLRLLPVIEGSGLLTQEQLERVRSRAERIDRERRWLEEQLGPADAEGRRRSLAAYLRSPGAHYQDLLARREELVSASSERLLLEGRDARSLELDVRYSGYVERLRKRHHDVHEMNHAPIPESLVYGTLSGLSTELREKLSQARPQTLGQAARLRGMTPAALDILAVHLSRGRAGKSP